MSSPRAVLLALLATLCVASSANASFSGSNGKVAWVDDGGSLLVDDPFDDVLEPAPLAQATTIDNGALAPQSAPQWSPDGTKIAYTAAVDNGQLPMKHSAVFVVNADGSGMHQVTSPFPGKVDSCPTCDDAESAWDVSPVWKNDNTLAFIRWVAAGDNAEHESQEGTSVRTVAVEGGGDTLLKHYPNEGKHGAVNVIWPNTWSEPVVTYVDASGYKLLGATSGTVFAAEQGIQDVDAAPNGQKLAYAAIRDGGFRVIVKDINGQVVDTYNPGYHPAWVRFTPDNNGLLVPGCADDLGGSNVCGLITHRLPDPDADVHPDEPADVGFLDWDIFGVAFPHLASRSNFDIQSQDLPMIYIPGFLGSQILCDGESVWMPNGPPLVFGNMQMQSDGLTNKTCPGAGPSGEVVDTFMLADVYGHANDWLAGMNPPGGWATLGWDWRKRPQETIDDLDDMIDSMLLNDLPYRQGAKRVSMVGHSYGALLMRVYVDEEARAKKVARMLTVGAPYWGSPKPMFGIAFGIELPGPSAIDAMAENDDMRDFVRNVSGAYHLTPSDNYGPWLTLENNPVPLDQAGVANWLTATAGGNGGLLSEAWATHRDHIDGFYDRHGTIDYRSVTGIGLLTIGKVNIMTPEAGPNEGGLTAGVFYEDGDGTVTGRSATQGPIGTTDPLGDDVHIQSRCGIAHMRQTADKVVQGAYAQFLVSGRLPRKLPAPNCPPEGQEIEVYHHLELEPPTPAANEREAGPLKLGDAMHRDLADVVRLPDRTLIVQNAFNAVPLTFEAAGAGFAITDLAGAERGDRLEYAPATGTVVIDATTGETPVVTVDGAPVEPVTDGTGGGNPEPTPTATPSATPTATPTATPQPSVACTAKVAKAKKALKKAKKAYARKHTKRNKQRVAKAKKAYKKAVRTCAG